MNSCRPIFSHSSRLLRKQQHCFATLTSMLWTDDVASGSGVAYPSGCLRTFLRDMRLVYPSPFSHLFSPTPDKFCPILEAKIHLTQHSLAIMAYNSSPFFQPPPSEADCEQGVSITRYQSIQAHVHPAPSLGAMPRLGGMNANPRGDNTKLASIHALATLPQAGGSVAENR
jgi:hypothetical protein